MGTVTEINDFLRVLFARVGTGSCPKCEIEIEAQSRDQVIDKLQSLSKDREYLILAPVVRRQKGEHRDVFETLVKHGLARVRVDGKLFKLESPPDLERQLRHDIEAVIDRIDLRRTSRQRLADAVETALRLGEGLLMVVPFQDGEESETRPSKSGDEILFSANYACPKCGQSYDAPSPQLLSFNSPVGMCRMCDGLGIQFSFDRELLIDSPKKSLKSGAIGLLGKWGQWSRANRRLYEGVSSTVGRAEDLDDDYLLTTPWNDLSEKHQEVWLHGTGERNVTVTWRSGKRPLKYGTTFGGIMAQLLSQWNGFKNPMFRRQYEKFMRSGECPSCRGDRLNAQARSLRLPSVEKRNKVKWLSLPQVNRLSIAEALEFFGNLKLNELQATIAAEAVKEVVGRLDFLMEVGLGYLSLGRTAPTLSGGESQRIRLASQIGSGLVGVLYVLDEPSIGLHTRDNDRLIRSLKKLRDQGNTLIVVEHDEDTMREADRIVDFGPGPGVLGGRMVVAGSLTEVQATRESVTGDFLSGRRKIETPSVRRSGSGSALKILGATHNNLKNIDVEIPLGTFVCVTGISGSGKSSLISDILSPELRRELNGAECEGGKHRKIEGIEHLDKIIDIDQSPIGRTPRSNPATYTKLFDEMRELFSQLPESKKRGYTAGRFSFNTPVGKCQACDGNGANRLEMELIADIWIPCTVCNGSRYDRETLQVQFKGKSIADCLSMDVRAAIEHFENIPKIVEKLRTLEDVGLGYLQLGQPSPTLSGGEAQRIKLTKELSKRSTGRTLYVLDEPTTGLHFADIQLLLRVLQQLVDRGNTVVVIEHNLDLIQSADWVIDLGPEGGEGGGRVVASGTPEHLVEKGVSATSDALRKYYSAKSGRIVARKAGRKGERTEKTSQKSKSQSRELTVRGASQHNLQEVDLCLPRDRMTVFCGPSGSGKTSLAFDTIYAEGQRRFVESLSPYARQFIGQMPKPSVQRIEGLSPAVAIEQKNLGNTPRSTVGTVTEVYDFLRVLMARLGAMHCTDCGRPVGEQSPQEIVESILALPDQRRFMLLANPKLDRNPDWESVIAFWKSKGFVRFRIDDHCYSAEDLPSLQRTQHYKFQVVVDRLKVDRKSRSRIADSVETALQFGAGSIQLAMVDDRTDERDWEEVTYSQHLACHHCSISFEPLTTHSFSFNSSLGWCPVCTGLGTRRGTNPAALIDSTKTIQEGGLTLWPRDGIAGEMLRQFCESMSIPMDRPIQSLPPKQYQYLMYGVKGRQFEVGTSSGNVPSFRFEFRGIYPTLELASRVSSIRRESLGKYVAEVECPDCHGARIRPEAAAMRFRELTMSEIVHQPLAELYETVKAWKLNTREKKVAGELVEQIRSRLEFLVDVGLDYLTLGRSANTLSGGESQRIRLASQLGSGLCGVLYVLDEPTVGLHPRDNARLIRAMHRLRDLGNTMIVVEHDREVISSSDYVCDFGPGAGRHGGQLVAEGTAKFLSKSKSSVTGPFLSGKKSIAIPKNRRPVDIEDAKYRIVVRNARENTLKDIDVAIPLGCLVAITGPSGSGKSSLVDGILYPALANQLHRAQLRVGTYGRIEGVANVNKVIYVDQSPIGNSPASTPATYSGVFELIRALYSQLPEARTRGYTARQFSFNVAGGRCEKCEGNGKVCIEMHFLPDLWVECEACRGRRFTEETLSVRYRGKSIYDLLEMPIGSALELLQNIPKIRRILKTLCDVGLDYLSLGQSSSTLSGGEAQRVKLASELARPDTGKTLYLLDEPTTGLHFGDIAKLMKVLHRLVDVGNTVLVVEHNLDVIKSADYVIDMGPEAGWQGGQVVAVGTPEQIAEHGSKSASQLAEGHRSYTGEALIPVLKAGPYEIRATYDPQSDLRQLEGDVSIQDIGRMAAAPWEVDGRKWHLEASLDRKGNAPRWERSILARVIEAIEATKWFDAVNWKNRSIVEVNAKGKAESWFLHAITAETWLLKLRFRYPAGSKSERQIQRELQLLGKLKLPTLNEIDEIESYSNESRVSIAKEDGWINVDIHPYRLAELDKPEFWQWLQIAMSAYSGQEYVEPKVVPKKANIKASKQESTAKAKPPKVIWENGLKEHLLEQIRKVESSGEWEWDALGRGELKIAEQPATWIVMDTSKSDCLRIDMIGPPDAIPKWLLKKGSPAVNWSRTENGDSSIEILLKEIDDVKAVEFPRLIKHHAQICRKNRSV